MLKNASIASSDACRRPNRGMRAAKGGGASRKACFLAKRPSCLFNVVDAITTRGACCSVFYTAFEGGEQKMPIPCPVRVISVPVSARNNKKWMKWLT